MKQYNTYGLNEEPGIATRAEIDDYLSGQKEEVSKAREQIALERQSQLESICKKHPRETCLGFNNYSMKKVLIADSKDGFTQPARKLYGRIGIEVDVAESYQEALDMISENTYDNIFVGGAMKTGDVDEETEREIVAELNSALPKTQANKYENLKAISDKEKELPIGTILADNIRKEGLNYIVLNRDYENDHCEHIRWAVKKKDLATFDQPINSAKDSYDWYFEDCVKCWQNAFRTAEFMKNIKEDPVPTSAVEKYKHAFKSEYDLSRNVGSFVQMGKLVDFIMECGKSRHLWGDLDEETYSKDPQDCIYPQIKDKAFQSSSNFADDVLPLYLMESTGMDPKTAAEVVHRDLEKSRSLHNCTRVTKKRLETWFTAVKEAAEDQ